ncbi:DEAD/DEAH box helicase [Sphingomonas sp. GCM10030256]|uniref:DEAD/DEAH box helicase n=1 Tax=Sphingomonas sp. GCM10030256 TaxID=3273427 RepID=UPI0036224C79
MRTLTPFQVAEELRQRSVEAVLGQSGLNHPSLAAEIRRRFGSRDIAAGALLQEPVLEPAFPFVEAEETLDSLAGSLLRPIVVDALDLPGDPRIGRDWHPYEHQLKSWKLLRDPTPQSVLVTSGTGSGKTECFMVPLLDDLVTEAEKQGQALSGVRAIMLYPLNALIASQQERLTKWTAPFKGKLRFALYNGEMPEDDKEGRERLTPEQVICRRTLRGDPPPILVTNVTMLEYLTVRRKDRPILEKSRGQLRWIILDEAHSYTGSKAAEIALLLRRVLLAFGVDSDQVRFVATSATIGEGKDVTDELRRFLRDVSGAGEERVHVVFGHRRRPQLPAIDHANNLRALQLNAMSPTEAFETLASNPVVQNVITNTGEQPRAWSELAPKLAETGAEPEALALALARAEKDGERLLPFRAHLLHRAIPGLWSCINPVCPDKPEGWPFGAVLPEAGAQCPSCDSVVLPIVSCRGCGEPFLDAVETARTLHAPDQELTEDEFAQDTDEEAAASGEGDGAPVPPLPLIERLIACRPLPQARPVHVDAKSGSIADQATDNLVTLPAHDREAPERCPACELSGTTKQPRVLWPFRFGAPAVLSNASPILLESTEAFQGPVDATHSLPADGRQLLSFTDSRQGTARFAAKLQNAAERNRVRSLVYFEVQDSSKPDPAITEKIAEFDLAIKATQDRGGAGAELTLRLLEQQRAELTKSSGGLSWERVRQRLAEQDEVSHWMRKVWAKRDPDRFRDEVNGPSRLSELMLLRELARRTKRANSLETMGLAMLRFAAIENLKGAHLPDALRSRGKKIEDWRDFLYLALTIAVRDYFAIRIDRRDAHWLQPGVPLKRLIGPYDASSGPSDLRWPQIRADYVGQRGTLPRLLEVGLRLDAAERGDRETINELLARAWDQLRPLIAAGTDNRLDLSLGMIEPVSKGWRCPVTRRVLDTVFCGYSPYGLRTGATRGVGARAEELEIPRHPAPFLREAGDEDRVRAWLSEDVAVSELRSRGIWTDLHDRIALGSPYARSAEHSAQQPSRRLRGYEAEFKRGEINILNCSTTMEMGVDIGSVSTVMMTNVPPSIANYRQRVGRAGRRRQATALAFTYCKDSPLEREAFRNPQRFLTRSVAAPRVSLDARPLVQRHVNALLLAAFIREQSGDATTAKAGVFFGYPADLRTERLPDPPSVAFQQWLTRPSTEAALKVSVEAVVKGSALEGDTGLFVAAAEAVGAAEAEFASEWQGLQSQAVGLDRATAKKAIGFSLKRLCDEFLLSDLSNRGVLPGHGFPTAVVQFVHSDEPDGDEGMGEEGNPMRRRHFASRNLDQAMRDYAPGADVVIDGLVYRSAGVTLNWKRPAGESERDVQSLAWVWRCSSCGTAGTTHRPLDQCDACGAAAIEQREYLKPAGFAAEKQPPHAEADLVSYVPSEPPVVVARGAGWQPLRVPELGKMRASRDGLVFHSNAGGETGQGYKLCLHCGRAQPEGGTRLPAFDQHEPLRYTKADDDGRCPGASRPFAIKDGLLLGYDVRTDVFELHLAGLDNLGAAWAFGSALRATLTRELGVEVGEVGLVVEPRAADLGGTTYAILLFDQAAGGAGFSPRAADLLPKLIEPIKTLLDCKSEGCERACSACVLTSDLRDQQKVIDRVAALAFLDDRLGRMLTPEQIDRFADGASFSDSLADELLAGKGPITVWSSLLDLSDLQHGSFRSFVAAAQRAGRAVALVLPPEAWAALDDATRLGLRDFATRFDLELKRGSAPDFENGAVTLAALPAEQQVWASRDRNAARAGASWGVPFEAPVLRAMHTVSDLGDQVDRSELELRPDAAFFRFTNDVDGPALGFGERMVAAVEPLLRRVGAWKPGQLIAINYYDRYLKSPMTVRLAVDFIGAAARALANGEPIQVGLVSEPYRPDPRRTGSPWQAVHDWQDDRVRIAVAAALGEMCGVDASLALRRDRHAREMELSFAGGGTVTLVLDQGFGCWRGPQGISLPFDFGRSPEEQASRLRSLNPLLIGPEEASYVVAIKP